jgi:APA family basic amino acid/polyamine antiporter
MNSKGIQYGKIILLLFTGSKLIALFILIVIGIYISIKNGFFDENFTETWKASKTVLNAETGTISITNLTTWGLIIALSTTIINSLFSSDAWNNVTFIAGEIRNPEKNLPRSLFLGTFIVTIFYVLANVAYLGLLPLKGIPVDAATALSSESVASAGIQFASESRVGTSAAYMMFGDSAQYLMAALIMISTFGCNNGLIMSGSRLFYAMSKENLFFKKAGILSKNGIPQFALWIQCAWASILCLSGSYQILIKFATFGSMLFYIVTITGLFVLRKKMPDLPRPYKAFGYPVIPFLYLLFAVIICVGLTVFTFQDTVWSIILILVGLPIYYFFFREKN